MTDLPPVRREFWVSPEYRFECTARPTDDETVFAKISDGKDIKDYSFMSKLKKGTLPSGNGRIIFNEGTYYHIRTEAIKDDTGECDKGVVVGAYHRLIRIDIIPPSSRPRQSEIEDLLLSSDYTLLPPPLSDPRLQRSGLLKDL